MSEKVKQSSFVQTDLNAFAKRTNAYIPGFIDYTSNVKIPADQFAAPTPQVQSDWNQSDDSAVDFIKNKPTIPAAQVQSDWEQDDSTAVDFIKNKPTIPAAQVQADWNQSDNTAADFIKNKPVNPGQQQADWNQTDTTAVDFIKNKPTITGIIQYLNWDGETNIYNTIKEHRDAGETVFITTPEGYTGIPMDDNPDGGRVCFMHMPASSVLVYTEFYAGGTPGFSQTTQGISTILTLSGSNYEYIWNSLNQVNGGCSFYTDENQNRYIFHHYTTESGVRSYYMYSLDPLSTIPIYVFKRSGSEGSYTYTRAKVTNNGLPVIIYAPTSSDLNNTKQNRVAICRLDKNHSDDGLHTDNYCEFLIHLYTGSTPNGNANSSLSLHVLASALEDGGPYNVDMRITANNNWDLDNARPTIATADTGTGNDGVIVFFGLFNRSNTAWVDFEQTNVTIVVLNPTPKLLGNTDKVDSLTGLVIHSLSPDNLPSVSAGNVNDCLCIGNDNSGTKRLRWKPNSADIELLTKETVTITDSTYQSLRLDRGKWYDVKISGNNVPELWLIGNSSDTMHTIVKLSRSSSSNSGVVRLDYWDERLEEHWIDCDLSNGKYYEFDVTIKDRYWDPISEQYVSLARVWRIVDDI